MTKSNREYWRERFEQVEDALNRDIAGQMRDIDRIYKRAQADIEKNIRAWYQRLAKNNEISMADARKLLSADELEEFKWSVEDYIKHGKENAIDQRWMKQLENASAKFHISKLEALKLQVQQSIEVIYGNQLDMLDETMRQQYQEGYYHTAFEVQKGFFIGWPIAAIDQAKIDRVIRKPWAPDGKNFSERIWQNRTKLVNEVHNELSRMCITGEAPDRAIKNIAKKMNTSRYNAGRLIMTEAAYFGSISQRDCFDDLGVEQYEICATLDNRTSAICQELDGKVFDMKDYEAGVTAPPFHVFCRSCTCPYFDDEFTAGEMRAARSEDGKTYYVPADMKYPEWKKQFTGGGKPKTGEVKSDELEKRSNKGSRQLLYPENHDKLDVGIRNNYEDEILKIPEVHRKIINGGINEIEIIKEGYSRFDREKKKMYLRENFEKGELIHEMAHVLETETNLYRDPKFREVLWSGLEDYSFKDVFYKPNSFIEPIYAIENKKFVSEYQGRTYIEVGLFLDDKLNPFALGEYFSEGYKTYIINPELLKKKDPQLYNYIKEMQND